MASSPIHNSGRCLPIIALFILVLSVNRLYAQLWDTFPSNEYEYSLRRDYILQKEAEMAGNDIQLSEDEQLVDHYLQYLKTKHFDATKDSGFPPLRPIQEVIDTIRASEIYMILKDLPKGGNMHTHENDELSRSVLLDIVWASEDFQNLYILPEDHETRPWTLDFMINPPLLEGWVKVEGHAYYTKERILQNLHLLGSLSQNASAYPSDSNLRWNDIGKLWNRAVRLISNIKIKSLYLEALYTQSLAEGVQYLETRKDHNVIINSIYELDPDPQYEETYGKHYLDTTGDMEIQLTIDAVTQFMANNPEFIGHNFIKQPLREKSIATMKSDMEDISVLLEKYPSHLKGFDIAAHEDAGHSNMFYLENFLSLYNKDTQKSDLPLVLHTAETSYPKDLITSERVNDPVATAQNAYESILLGSRRLGHGLAYIKFPYLLEEIKATNTAIEVCPVSNQLLGYQPDIRNHPAVNYMKMDIPIILGSDDAGIFGVDNITLDWYEAYMAWGLGLKDLKMLANNSLSHSLMTETEKETAIRDKWMPRWDSYIQSVKQKACNDNLQVEIPQFYRLLPAEGALTGSTNVHVFGRHFEWGLCETIKCYFGTTEGPMVYYVSSNHIICVSPEGTGSETTVPVIISFNGGSTFFETNLDYTYKHPPTNVDPSTKISSGTSGAATKEFVTAGTVRVEGSAGIVAILLVISLYTTAGV